MPCSRSAAASASSSSAIAPPARRRSPSTRSSIRRTATSSASTSPSARRPRASVRVIDAIASRTARPSAASSSWRRLGELARPAMDRPVRRLHHRRVFPRSRPACPDRHRRSDQARRHPSRDRAADAPAARPRGLSGRRILSALPPARARREAVAELGRRLADRPPYFVASTLSAIDWLKRLALLMSLKRPKEGTRRAVLKPACFRKAPMKSVVKPTRLKRSGAAWSP